MATCAPEYVPLPCSLSGLGNTSKAFQTGDTKLQLMQGHGAYFPDVPAGSFFYVTVISSCGDCCEEMKVTAKSSDVLTVERLDGACDCFQSNSRVRYNAYSKLAVQAIAEELPFNVVSPLEWDCETRTLTINCEVMIQEMIESCLSAGDGGDDSNLAQQVAQNTQDIAEMGSQLSSKASNQDLGNLTTRVSNVEDKANSNASQINVLNNKVADMAASDNIAALQDQVTSNTTGLIAANNNLDSLGDTVSDMGDVVTDIGDAVTTNTQDISDVKDAQQALTSRVTANEQQIATNTQDIDDLKNP